MPFVGVRNGFLMQGYLSAGCRGGLSRNCFLNLMNCSLHRLDVVVHGSQELFSERVETVPNGLKQFEEVSSRFHLIKPIISQFWSLL